MRRSLLTLTLVLAACGGAASTPTDVAADTTVPASDVTSAEGSSETTSPQRDDSEAGETPTTEAPDESATNPDLPLAPDFTLELGNGGEYVLSENEKPVYLVFWAEW